jgi:hypothetical protein
VLRREPSPGATVVSFMEHYWAEQGTVPKVPVATIAAILLNVSDGFVQAARVDADALFATFLDLFIPAVMGDQAGEV